MKTSYKFYKCKECGTDFMSDSSNPSDKCDTCLGKAPAKIEGAPNLGTKDRLGDNPFPKASNDWKDLLRKIKKENPGSTIDIK